MSNNCDLKLEKFTPELPDIEDITLSQPEDGYRFSIDPFILASHVQPHDAIKIIDAGCGCGVISILLAKKYSDLLITGIEIQSELAASAKKNVSDNDLENRIVVLCRDLKETQPEHINGRADIMVSNPPYKKRNTGRLNPNRQKAVARHEIHLDIEYLFISAKRLLNQKGRLYLIFPAERLEDINLSMAVNGFKPIFYRLVHTKKATTAKWVIVCAAKKNIKPCITLPSLFIETTKRSPGFKYLSTFKP